MKNSAIEAMVRAQFNLSEHHDVYVFLNSSTERKYHFIIRFVDPETEQLREFEINTQLIPLGCEYRYYRKDEEEEVAEAPDASTNEPPAKRSGGNDSYEVIEAGDL